MNLSIKQRIKKTINFGNSYFCPVCESHLRGFKPYGVNRRPNAVCPVCGSVERHRLIWLYLKNKTDLFSSDLKRMLHIAPENCFYDQFKSIGSLDYLAGDLFQPTMIKVDITDIQFPDDHFDIIYCSHVLEHVPNDHKAMTEFARVLKPSGWAILQVPIDGDTTREDLSITDSAERTRLYGQPDHVRYYGRDYKDRLESSGLQVTLIPYAQEFSPQQARRYGFSNERDDIYFCQTR